MISPSTNSERGMRSEYAAGMLSRWRFGGSMLWESPEFVQIFVSMEQPPSSGVTPIVKTTFALRAPYPTRPEVTSRVSRGVSPERPEAEAEHVRGRGVPRDRPAPGRIEAGEVED